MKRLLALPILATIFMLSGCASTTTSSGNSTAVWVNKEKIKGKTFDSIFIMVMTADIEARVKLETDLANIVINRGHKALKSLDVLPFDLNDPKLPAKEEVVRKIKASGCDAVFVASLLRKDDSVRHTAGKSSYSLTAYYTYVGGFYGFYSNWYQAVSVPGYYAQNQSYFVLSNLYDVASEEIMWSAQSDLFDPTNLKEFSGSYTKSLMQELEAEKLVKKN